MNLDFDDYGKHDLHIHGPAGATPKDGPSAGVTICAALASWMSKRRVRSDVAMTGEISLRGRVMRVGGIKEKVIAASRFGVKQVILPAGNKPDWQDVPAEVRAKMKVHFVKQISEVLRARARGENEFSPPFLFPFLRIKFIWMGKVFDGCFPLTPALSPQERENCFQFSGQSRGGIRARW